MKPSKTYYAVLKDASEEYAKQPWGKKNLRNAVYNALDKHSVLQEGIRRDMLSAVCAALGKAGGNEATRQRNQLKLFPR